MRTPSDVDPQPQAATGTLHSILAGAMSQVAPPQPQGDAAAKREKQKAFAALLAYIVNCIDLRWTLFVEHTKP